MAVVCDHHPVLLSRLAEPFLVAGIRRKMIVMNLHGKVGRAEQGGEDILP